MYSLSGDDDITQNVPGKEAVSKEMRCFVSEIGWVRLVLFLIACPRCGRLYLPSFRQRRPAHLNLFCLLELRDT